MSEPDEAMVEAVRRAIHTADNEWASAPKTEPHEPWDLYVAKAVASVPVVRDALARDGRAGCHAITDDDGTTYCPLAEANMRAVARDAQVQAEMQNVDCGVIAEHPCAGPCLGCGAGPDESCSGGCRCDEGEDCAISVLLEADRVPLRRIAAIHGLYPSPTARWPKRTCERDPQVETVPAKKSATEAADTDIRGCNCASYNNPEKVRQTVSGPVSEVVLTPPPELGIERETVCVDACIATVVQHLWSCGVVTLGSCCGHGRERPGLVLGQHEDMAVARACISGVDDRAWDLSQWRLVKNTDMNPANKERNDQ